MKRSWRILATLMVTMVAVATPAMADHGPWFDVTCPTGTAQIVLDPGHGGSDPGAIDEVGGLQESDLNLEIVQRVAGILRKSYGYTVALTREDAGTERGNSERGTIANACSAIAFVEVHLNSTDDHAIDYAQTFWGEKEKDLAFSLVMNRSLESLGIPVNAVERFDNGGLLRAKMPSVLVEAVFLSNTRESNSLQAGTRQAEIAEAVAEGIASWLTLWNNLN